MHRETFLLMTTIIFWNFSPKVLKIYRQVFVFFNSKNLLSSIGQCTWLHLYFPYGKFHLDIHNKMTDNNSTALPHEKDFDISKDRFCWIDIFIRWFEDYQLPYQFVRLLLKAELFRHVRAIICRPDFTCFSRRTPPHFYSIAWVFLSLGKTSGPTTKTAGSEVLP